MTQHPLKHPLRVFLDLSSGHITKETGDWLDAKAWTRETVTRPEAWVGITPYGWFVYADEDGGSPDLPEDLALCMKKARELGAEYILFDCDAPLNTELGLSDHSETWQ
jgi:hypothetical protein